MHSPRAISAALMASGSLRFVIEKMSRRNFFFYIFRKYNILRVHCKSIFSSEKKIVEIATLTAACIFDESSAPHTST